MKIVKIGSFDEKGRPIDWSFDLEDDDGVAIGPLSAFSIPYCLGISGDLIDPNSPVTVNGVEIVEWTEKRRAAMAHEKN